MLLDHCYAFGFVAVAFQSEEEVFLRRGPPVTYFCPTLDPPLGGSSRKNNNTCKGPWVLHPYQVSSKSIQWFWRRSRNVNCLTDDRRRTDAGQRVITIGHWSLWLLCPKKVGVNKQPGMSLRGRRRPTVGVSLWGEYHMILAMLEITTFQFSNIFFQLALLAWNSTTVVAKIT